LVEAVYVTVSEREREKDSECVQRADEREGGKKK